MTPTERRAWELYLYHGYNQTQAYIETHKAAQEALRIDRDKDYRRQASRYFLNIKNKLSERGLLEAYDLGDDRLFRELNERLESMKTEFYKGKPIAECIDNTTRMRATELLADILGRRKHIIQRDPDDLDWAVDLGNLSDEELLVFYKLLGKANGKAVDPDV